MAKSRKKKKKGAYERSADDGVKIKKQRRGTEIFDEDVDIDKVVSKLEEVGITETPDWYLCIEISE